MRLRQLCASVTLSALALAGIGCSLHSKSGSSARATARSYSATASVGDFITIQIDDAAGTIAYHNWSNGDVGTATFTVDPTTNAYAITDPSGNLISAREIEGYALILQAAHTGPDHATPSIITAITTETISATMDDGDYNYMQFRTNSGGLEIGPLMIRGGDVDCGGFWPYGEASHNHGTGLADGFMGGGTMPASAFERSADGTYLRLPQDEDDNGIPDDDDGDGVVDSYSYIFRTTGGFFAVDTPNGAIVCLRQAATKDFLPANAGLYRSMMYRKVNAQTGSGNVETGTQSLGAWTIDVTSAGLVTVNDGATDLAVGTLAAIEDTPRLYDGTAARMAGPCHGAFTFQVVSGTTTRDVFVIFLTDAMLISSFQTDSASPGTYEYFYGVGLRDAGTGG